MRGRDPSLRLRVTCERRLGERREASGGPAGETLRCGSELALNAVNGVTREPCHAEHIRYAQCKLREASGGPAGETLRCGSELALNAVNGVTRERCHVEHIRYAQCKLREAS
jgi:hypothetical protein